MPLERYRIGEPLGRSNGEVHRAFDTRLHRAVALKLVKGDGAAGLLREARAAAALRHPNIVIIYDIGEEDGTAYIAMELLDGKPLRDYIGEHEVPLDRRLGWLRDVAAGVAAVHAIELVHRDINPDNVVVTNTGVAKLLDFGIARAAHADANTTSVTFPIATRSYQAPEQRAGAAATPASDQFAWAVVAVELLTGNAIDTPEPAERALLDAEVPAAIASAIARALQAPESRWPSMAAIVDVLEAAGVTSAPPSGDDETAPPTAETARFGALPSITSSLVEPAPRRAEAKRTPRRRWRWIVASCVAAGFVLAVIAWRRRDVGATQRDVSPACEIAADIPVENALGPEPIELTACEGRLLATTTLGTEAQRAWGAIDGPLVMKPVRSLGLPVQHALPLCRGEGIAAVLTWVKTMPREMMFSIVRPDPGPIPFVEATTSTTGPTRCAATMHPAGDTTFVVCELDDPKDPRLFVQYYMRAVTDGFIRDELSSEKPHAITTIYPFDDRPFIAYRISDRVAGIFASPFGSANQESVDLAHGRVGDPALATKEQRVLVVWPEDAGDGYVLRGAWVAHNRAAEPAATGDPRSSAARPTVLITDEGVVLAWVEDDATGALRVGYGIDIADAASRSRIVARNASHPRLTTRGRVVFASWRESNRIPHVARLDCKVR